MQNLLLLMCVLMDNPQFAYLQLGTIITTIIRRVELRLEGDKFPQHNYHVSSFLYFVCYKSIFLISYPLRL
jgi:membrane-anchored glycerophosphoryl diester phosphodiesterase (GDPDase)